MFCPFVNGECREDCTFRHRPRATVGGIDSLTSVCTLAIVADEYDRKYLDDKKKEEG